MSGCRATSTPCSCGPRGAAESWRSASCQASSSGGGGFRPRLGGGLGEGREQGVGHARAAPHAVRVAADLAPGADVVPVEEVAVEAPARPGEGGRLVVEAQLVAPAGAAELEDRVEPAAGEDLLPLGAPRRLSGLLLPCPPRDVPVILIR